MINFDDVTKKNIKEHNLNLQQIPDHPYKIWIIGGSESEKANSLFNLIWHQPDIDKSYLYVKDPYEAKCQFLIDTQGSTSLKNWMMLKLLLNIDMANIYTNVEEYNQNKKLKILIFFDNMIADMLSNNNHNPIFELNYLCEIGN